MMVRNLKRDMTDWTEVIHSNQTAINRNVK